MKDAVSRGEKCEVEDENGAGSGASMRSLRGSTLARAAGILKSPAMSLRVRKAFRCFKTDERIDSRGGTEGEGSRGKRVAMSVQVGHEKRVAASGED
jgi:hypothetical protein